MSTRVTTMDRAIEPRQPSRLLKKRNTTYAYPLAESCTPVMRGPATHAMLGDASAHWRAAGGPPIPSRRNAWRSMTT